MSHVIEALELTLKLAKMSIPDCIDAKDAVSKFKESCEQDRKKYGMASKIQMQPTPREKKGVMEINVAT